MLYTISIPFILRGVLASLTMFDHSLLRYCRIFVYEYYPIGNFSRNNMKSDELNNVSSIFCPLSNPNLRMSRSPTLHTKHINIPKHN